MSRPKFILAHKPDPNRRTTSDSVWPLRGLDGRPVWKSHKGRVTQSMVNAYGSYAAARAAMEVEQ